MQEKKCVTRCHYNYPRTSDNSYVGQTKKDTVLGTLHFSL